MKQFKLLPKIEGDQTDVFAITPPGTAHFSSSVELSLDNPLSLLLFARDLLDTSEGLAEYDTEQV